MELNYDHAVVWGSLLLCAAAVWITAVAVYRVVFHPLARYPGPLLAKLTDAYMLYHAWKGDRHLEFWRLHETYGPIVRFSPNGVSFNSSSALRDIYGFRGNVRKAAFYDAFAHPAHNTHNTRDKAEHARKRRVLSHAFSDSAIKEAERYILANVRTFCAVAGGGGTHDKGWTAPKNMSDLCNYLAMDILGDLCFGKAFRMLEAPDNRYAVDLVGVAAQRHLLCGTMPIIDRLRLDHVLFRHIAAGRGRYMQYSRAQLAERMALGEDADRRDFFYYLLRARDPETGQGFSTPELWAESNLLIIAGSDTTSTSMAATLFYLVRHPAALARATGEVRGAFAAAAGADGKKDTAEEAVCPGPALTGCTYLRACIDEAMRLSPAVGGLLPREVLAGGMQIDGAALPAGTVVGVPHYAVHHNARYFPEPFAFRPERWIAGSTLGGGGAGGGQVVTDDDVARAQAAFCPFSLGPRGCIGKGLAYTEMMTTLARLLVLYDVRRAAGVADPGEGRADAEWGRQRPGEFQLRDVFTSMKDGAMVEFRRA